MISQPQQMQDQSSDLVPAPFIGRYHSVLRKRNKVELEVAKPKKEYKKKKLQYKNLVNIYQYWKLELPLPQQHIYNFHNILAINEQSMLNPDWDQSFISTKFYMKKVKNVKIHRHSLLLTLEDMEMACTPISYICQRFKSLGNSMFMKMAETLQHVEETLPEISRKLRKEQQIDQNQLQEFLKEMDGKLFFSQYSPHLLIISNSLIEMLGFDIEEFAIEAIKHKSILYEFFSAQNYAKVINQHLENIQLLRQYLEGAVGLQQFCQRSLMVYNDTVFNRKNQKIQCQFYAGTSKQLTPYIEIKNMSCDTQAVRKLTPEMDQRAKKVEEFKQIHHCREYDLLKKLIKLPEQMDPRSKDKICRYQVLESPMIEELSSDQQGQ